MMFILFIILSSQPTYLSYLVLLNITQFVIFFIKIWGKIWVKLELLLLYKK